MATTPGQWPLAFFFQRTRGLITSRIIHLIYDIVGGIIVIWIPNQDSGIFGNERFKLFIKDTGSYMG
jgi:hypothetical protein